MEDKELLRRAVEEGQEKEVKVALKGGANLNDIDEYGNTLLHTALSAGQYRLAQYMLPFVENYNEGNADGSTPLHILAKTKQVKLAKQLLAEGADVSSTDNRGRTPLMLACEKGCFPMATMLLKKGSNPSITDSHGWTAMDYASAMGNNNVANLLEKYAKKDANALTINGSESSSAEEEQNVAKTIPKGRIIPIKINYKEDNRKQKNAGFQGTEGTVKSREKANGKHENIPSGLDSVVTMLSSTSSMLEETHSWFAEEQSATDDKIRQNEEQVKTLGRETRKFLEEDKGTQYNIEELIAMLEKSSNHEESLAMLEQCNILKEGMEELEREYDKVIQEKEELEKILENQRKMRVTSTSALERKVEQLKRGNKMVEDKLNEIKTQTDSSIDDLTGKCNSADEIIGHLKRLLREIYKLLEDKQDQASKVMEKLTEQNRLLSIMKENYNSLKAENIHIEKNFNDISIKINKADKNLSKLQKEMETDPLVKKIIDSDIMDTKKEEPKKSNVGSKAKGSTFKTKENFPIREQPKPQVKPLADQRPAQSRSVSPKGKGNASFEARIEHLEYSRVERASRNESQADQTAPMNKEDKFKKIPIAGNSSVGVKRTSVSSGKGLASRLQAKIESLGSKHTKEKQ